jgi:transposase-like protein
VIPQAAIIQVNCQQCQAKFRLEYETGGKFRRQEWMCPTCGHRNELNMAGRIVYVTPRSTS